MPIVGELQLKSGMVTGFDLEDVTKEVGSQVDCQGLDHPWPFGLSSRQVGDLELLIRLEHDEIGSEDNSALFAFVVVYLAGRIEWTF